MRQLDTLTDEKAYQLLDYVEFVASRHGAKESSVGSLFTRFTEGVEDTLRAGKVSATAISETMGLLNKAVGVLNGVAAAGKSVASDIVSVATSTTKPATDAPESPAPETPPSAGAPPA
jgi:formylmethanofuran:tetrahydromethanopterin formyltransferase